MFVALLLIAGGVVYVSERSATHARITDNPFVWFVALKYDSDAEELPFVESGHKIELCVTYLTRRLQIFLF